MMNYRSIDLALEQESAHERITTKVDGLSVRRQGKSIEYRTPSGFHLATLTDVRLPNGQRGTRLKFRTAVVAAWAAHTRRKAAEIRDAVVSDRYSLE